MLNGERQDQHEAKCDSAASEEDFIPRYVPCTCFRLRGSSGNCQLWGVYWKSHPSTTIIPKPWVLPPPSNSLYQGSYYGLHITIS